MEKLHFTTKKPFREIICNDIRFTEIHFKNDKVQEIEIKVECKGINNKGSCIYTPTEKDYVTNDTKWINCFGGVILYTSYRNSDIEDLDVIVYAEIR